MRRLAESRVGCGRIAVPYLGRDVAGGRGPHQRCAGSDGVVEIDDHRQRVVADVDGFGRVAGLLPRCWR